MFCPKCGTQNADTSDFCSNCGESLTEARQVAGLQNGAELDVVVRAGSPDGGTASPAQLVSDVDDVDIRLEPPVAAPAAAHPGEAATSTDSPDRVIRFACTHCHHHFRASAEQAGQVGTCSHCGGTITVPLCSTSATLPPPPPPPWQIPPPEVPRRLESADYEHPFDRDALQALQCVPGLPALLRKYDEVTVDAVCRIQFTGSFLEVNDQTLPDLHLVLREICQALHVPDIPRLYLTQGYEINASTTGVTKPVICLNNSCLDRLTPGELLFVVGHEVGHIKSNHVLYHQLGSWLPTVVGVIGESTLGIGSLVAEPVLWALYNWQRMSELTADRAGLLACRDIDHCVSAFVKLAGLPPSKDGLIDTQGFLAQARGFEGWDVNGLDRIVKLLLARYMGHPWTVMRGGELLKWVEGGEYQQLVSRLG